MSFHDLNIPPSSATVVVKAFNLIDDLGKIVLSASAFFTPILPGHEQLRCPIYAFLVENTTTKERIMFDLGLRVSDRHLVVS